jgi:glycosyltransferase involved in cell wall biosynthesis
MPRILLLITDLQIGGTPTVVRELAVRLRALAPDAIHVACLAGWGPVADQIHEAGVPVEALGARSPKQFPSIVARLHRLIRQWRIDTVLSFLMHANAVAAASRLCNPHVRFIQSVQTTQPTPRWHWAVQAAAHYAAERVLVPSESVAVAARQRSHVPAEKIGVIPNAIDRADYTDLDTRQRRPTSIGFLGRLDPIKRVGDLVAAMRHVDRSARLDVYGDGPERQGIADLVVRLGLEASVVLRGVVPRPQAALQDMSVLVLPSAAEGFPMVLIEAMAAGVAVIGADAPGIRDVIRDGQTGLLVPGGNPKLLAAAIQRLSTDDALRETLVRNALADVTGRFTWEIVLPQYRQLLRL